MGQNTYLDIWGCSPPKLNVSRSILQCGVIDQQR